MKHLCFELQVEKKKADRGLVHKDGLIHDPEILVDKSIVCPVGEAIFDSRFQRHLAKLQAKKDAGIKITKADLWHA